MVPHSEAYLQRTSRRTRSGEALYSVRCECGNECFVRTSKRKSWKTCAPCRRKLNALNQPLMGSANGMWKGTNDIPGEYLSRIKRRAKRIGIVCSLGMKDLQDLFDKQKGLCAYSGVKLERQDLSLDRIDSGCGYSLGNVQWLHKRVNWIKNTLSEKEFLYWVGLIAAHKSSTLTEED